MGADDDGCPVAGLLPLLLLLCGLRLRGQPHVCNPRFYGLGRDVRELDVSPARLDVVPPGRLEGAIVAGRAAGLLAFQPVGCEVRDDGAAERGGDVLPGHLLDLDCVCVGVGLTLAEETAFAGGFAVRLVVGDAVPESFVSLDFRIWLDPVLMDGCHYASLATRSSARSSSISGRAWGRTSSPPPPTASTPSGGTSSRCTGSDSPR